MHRRHQHLNIPIEIVRTVVAISETGSLSKAAERLGLSQPAVSSQVKRLQSLVGGSLFSKTANGTTTTDLGKLALHQARRILEANDQLLRLGGNDDGPQVIRLGLSTLFVNAFIESLAAETLADIFVHADHSTSIGRGLIDGYIDVGCLMRPVRSSRKSAKWPSTNTAIHWSGCAREISFFRPARQFRSSPGRRMIG